MPKMISLKMPSIKEKKDTMPMMNGMNECYPYSTRITLDGKLADKFKALIDGGVGDKICICADAEIVEVSKNDRKDHSSHSVTFQLTDMSIEADEDSEMDDGFEKGSDEGEE